MSESDVKICFCGSGSGGHLKPLVSLYLKLGMLQSKSFFICSPHPFDQSFIQDWDLPTEFLTYTRISQGNVLFVIWKIFYCLIEVLYIFLKKKPDLVIGTGGYGSFPVYLACVLLNIDFYIIEPNSICGKVNRWFQTRAKKIFTNFSNVLGLQALDSICHSGVPLVYEKPCFTQDKLVLIFGASLGAQSINKFMKSYFEAYGADESYSYVWITGASEYEEYKYFQEHGNIEVFPFVKEMQQYLQRASLVISRSGAGCVADVKHFQIPAIFVPYPHHADRQQYLNAQDLNESGACMIWEESSLSDLEYNRASELKKVLNSGALKDMKSRFSQNPQENAVETILKIVLKGKLIGTR
ncbi:MAG: UDP-N-acetylglucosamine--N-acetylmuramyl-(pentapeptide) pyrophosphoryl-undecaprenol N-acetylglucosamine transferase [Candidatus Cloacimonetes bacterium]|nr:UDP-N-acetylglucosamine--N-acetylmuramyl-(pentapeptide) pyrophosphoryl-undecaprenol N-acetylglucosamine transferase [Candidatus Cloacimonadota bacterium]